jgi:hypothetical protein
MRQCTRDYRKLKASIAVIYVSLLSHELPIVGGAAEGANKDPKAEGGVQNWDRFHR